MRRLLLLAILVVAVAPAAARADYPQLVGVVGTNDAFAISLSFNGAPVHNLDPGTYTLLVHDRSSFHDFHLKGPGVDVASDIEGTGDQTFTITLVQGTYTFQCDPHASSMHGTFTVGNVVATPSVTKVSGSVGPGKKIGVSSSLSGSGAGVFQFAIADRSKKLTLKPGTYPYRSDAHPSLRGSFTIAS